MWITCDRGGISSNIEAELARLRAENVRLLKLLELTPQQAASPGPAQAAYFGAAPRLMHRRSPEDDKVAFFGAPFAVADRRVRDPVRQPADWEVWLDPAVRGDWRKGYANEDRNYLPLSLAVLASHLTGEVHVGLYPLLDG